jgi:hypothetical protein
MADRGEARMCMPRTMADRDVGRMFTLPIMAEQAAVARIMWPLEATGRLEREAVLRFVAARVAARVTVRNCTAVGRAARVTPMSLTLLVAGTIGRREPAVSTPVAAATASRLT